MPRIHTGVSVSDRARSSLASTTAAAPSVIGEHMNSRSGLEIIREQSTWSSVAPLLKWALGFCAAWVWFFTPTRASCSSVVPYSAMCRWAASAKQGGAVRPKAASHSRSTPVPMLRIASSPLGWFSFSTPRTMMRSASPAAMNA